jgi:hypothetical protein
VKEAYTSTCQQIKKKKKVADNIGQNQQLAQPSSQSREKIEHVQVETGIPGIIQKVHKSTGYPAG